MEKQITPRVYFDYNALPDKTTRATLRSEATAIKAAVKRTHDNIIEIGNRLTHAKEVAGHGNFLEWIDAEFGMSDRHARNFIHVAEAFGKSEMISDLNLPDTALFLLAAPSVSEETRTTAIELAQSGDLKTVKDAKVLIEAAKPPRARPPVAPELPMPIVEDDDFDPFADEDEVVIEPAKVADSRPLESAPQVKPTTLKQRVKNAEVIHDTLDSKIDETQLNDEDWLESLPIFRVLKQKQHRAIFLRRDLLSTRQLLEQLDLFEHHARRAFNFKSPSGTPAESRVIGAASMPRPLDWQICAPCKGNGCGRCAHAGYDLTGAGISPLRIESGEVTL